MSKTITIELPEEIHALIESDPSLKAVIEKIVREDVVSYVLSILAMDKLAEGSKLTEEDVMKIDKIIKEEIKKRSRMRLILELSRFP